MCHTYSIKRKYGNVNETEYKINEAIRNIGRGVWFTIPVIAKRAGVSKTSARKYLNRIAESGDLRTVKFEYRKHIEQTCFIWDIGGEVA